MPAYILACAPLSLKRERQLIFSRKEQYFLAKEVKGKIKSFSHLRIRVDSPVYLSLPNI